MKKKVGNIVKKKGTQLMARIDKFKKNRTAKKAVDPIRIKEYTRELPKTGKIIKNYNLKNSVQKKQTAIQKTMSQDVENIGNLYRNLNRANNVRAGKIPYAQLTNEERAALRSRGMQLKKEQEQEEENIATENPFLDPEVVAEAELRLPYALKEWERKKALPKVNPFDPDPKKPLLSNLINEVTQEERKREKARPKTNVERYQEAQETIRNYNRRKRVNSMKRALPTTGPQPMLTAPPVPRYNALNNINDPYGSPPELTNEQAETLSSRRSSFNPSPVSSGWN